MGTTIVNVRYHGYDVYIGRGTVNREYQGSMFGNPFFGPNWLEHYKEWFYRWLEKPYFRQQVLKLRGNRLGCHCVGKPISVIRDNKVCHGEIILEYLEENHILRYL